MNENKSLYPPSFGPGSYRGLSEDLIRIYSKLQNNGKPIELEQEETPPPSEELEAVEA